MYPEMNVDMYLDFTTNNKALITVSVAKSLWYGTLPTYNSPRFISIKIEEIRPLTLLENEIHTTKRTEASMSRGLPWG